MRVESEKKVEELEHVDIEDSPEKTLLVTGGCGFIGSHFINHFMKKYTKIKLINLDAMYYCADESNVSAEIRADKDRYTLIKGSICSMDLVKYVVESHSIQYVVHFAAQSHVQHSFTDSLRYTNDNVVGTHTLLECFRQFGSGSLEKFIHCSTDEVYGESMLKADETHKTEQSVLCPTNPYAATKAAAELIAQSYNHSFKMPVLITRGNNVYGPNQYDEKLIPCFISQLLTDKKVTVQGDGTCVRAFLHAYDTAEAFIKVLERGEIGEIYNIGCDEGMEFSVMQIAEKLISKIKGTDASKAGDWITYIPDRPFNDKRYYISNQKLKDLGWKIRVELNDGLDHLIEFMTAQAAGLEGKVDPDVRTSLTSTSEA
jgi:dTDP-glucose 4,6-dehydratase